MCKKIKFILLVSFQVLLSYVHAQAIIDEKVWEIKTPSQEVILLLKDQADLTAASLIKGKNAKAKFVYEALLQKAESTQVPLIQSLNGQKIAYRSFYIINMISAHMTHDQIKSFALNNSLSSIISVGRFIKSEDIRDDLADASRLTEWNITKIKADSVWSLFTNGAGSIIGGQDTGYDWVHPAIKSKYRGWNGTSATHDYYWHDAIHSGAVNPCGYDSAVPCDDHNHGTHTMGTMVGDTTNYKLGVAPGAKWIGCRNMNQGNGTLTTYVECFEWFLAPYPVSGTTAQGNPSLAPHVINNSWSCPPSEGCNSSNFAIMNQAILALRAAGVVVVASAGNDGTTGCNSVSDPPAIFDASFSVGSTTSSDGISSFSSRGPVTVDGSQRLKPDVCAPGSSIKSCIRNGAYATYNGTSMAGPHVAGTVALIIAANPSLAGEVDQIENILKETALPLTSSTQNCGGILGTEIPNNTYGHGRIDALAAVKRAVNNFAVPKIKIDQFGYLPNAKKIAILSDPIIGYNAADSYTPSANIRLKDAVTHAVVFSAAPQSWNGGTTHSQSGDKAWWFDFSSFSTSGTYYVSDGAVRSEPFEINDSVYQSVFKKAFNNFYHQRCGVAKSSTHVGAYHADGVCHSQDVQCRFISQPSNVSLYKNLSGGWHDAGDYNKYVNFAYNAVLPLLLSFEYNPEAYGDNHNIPESNNGIPDLLDEVKYELDWLLKMQAIDGGVHCIVGVQNFATASPPSADAATRYYGPKTTSATFSSAAMFALAATQFKKINNTTAQAYATTLQNAAINAWTWGNAFPQDTFRNTGIVAAGEQEVDLYERNMRKLGAAIYLYELTNSSTYKTYVESNYTSAHLMQWSYAYVFEFCTQANLIHYASLKNISTGVGSAIKNTYTNAVMNSNEIFRAYRNKTDAYRSHLPDGHHVWGSNARKTDMGNILQAIHHYNLDLTRRDSAKMAMAGFVHYIHGSNATGLCYLSNMRSLGAENSINTIYHAWFSDGSSLWDDVRTSTYGPPPGIVSGGVNPGWHLDGCCGSSCSSDPLCVNQTPPSGQPILKSYRDWNTSWPQNSWEITENAIGYQASYLFLLSGFVNSVSRYSSTPVTSTIHNSDAHVLNSPLKGLVLKSQNGTMYRLSVSNTGSLSTQVVPSLSNANARVDDSSLNIKSATLGIILKSPNASLWRINIANNGSINVSNITSLPTTITKIDSGDLFIVDSDQGLILKDLDGNCYYITVGNTGLLFSRAVDCEG